ncbi:MAG: hypothetical protein MZV70_11165 [Desulfobacterales bacterium]|nr:hypothetical protein [Desulfobacterales bacterium]
MFLPTAFGADLGVPFSLFLLLAVLGFPSYFLMRAGIDDFLVPDGDSPEAVFLLEVLHSVDFRAAAAPFGGGGSSIGGGFMSPSGRHRRLTFPSCLGKV